ncbi:helix-turn-helix transcriptional regulator [Pedococcus sp. P5_B7]
MPADPLVDPTALRAARERAGLTQHELARLIGVAGGERVSRWERGASEPRPEVLQRIAGVLKVRTVNLLAAPDGAADLRRLRVVAGLSARQVAERSHVSLPTYARWESGQTMALPPASSLDALAEILGVRPAEVAAALMAARRVAE